MSDSVGFSRQEYWSGLPFPSPGDLPDPGIEPRSPALQTDPLTSEPPAQTPGSNPGTSFFGMDGESQDMVDLGRTPQGMSCFMEGALSSEVHWDFATLLMLQSYFSRV